MASVASMKLVFPDGYFYVTDIGLPAVEPADPLEYPPTKFITTGDTEITLHVGFDHLKYAETLFMRGGILPCTLQRGESVSPHPLTFSPTGWDISFDGHSTYGTLIGYIRNATIAGAPLPDELNAYYAGLHKPQPKKPGTGEVSLHVQHTY